MNKNIQIEDLPLKNMPDEFIEVQQEEKYTFDSIFRLNMSRIFASLIESRKYLSGKERILLNKELTIKFLEGFLNFLDADTSIKSKLLEIDEYIKTKIETDFE